MSQKDILSSIKQKIKNLQLQQKEHRELFYQFFTDQVKGKIKSIIINPNELWLSFEQLKNKNNSNNNQSNENEFKNQKEDKEILEEFENDEKDENKQVNISSIYNLPNPQKITGFICFLKGLFFENAFIGDKEDYQKSLESYKHGIQIQVDSLCAYRLAEIFSSDKLAQKFSVKVDKELAYAYLIIADAYLDVQYNNNLININKDVEQVSSNFMDQQIFAIDNLKKHQQVIFETFQEKKIISEVEQIESFLSFKHSSQENSQTYYTNMIHNLSEKNDASSLLLLIRIMCNQTHNSNKQVKKIIEECKKSSLQSMNQNLQWLLSDIMLLSVLEKDHEVFNCARTTFIEMFNLFKIISLDTMLLVSSNPSEYNPIHKKINAISELLFQHKQTFKNQLHNVLLIRIRAEILKKGIGIEQSFQKSLQTIENEKEIKKEQESLYAYYYYKKANLLEKLNRPNEEIQNNLNISQDLFIQRLTSTDLTTQVLAHYYLGRIFLQNSQNQRKAQDQFNFGLQCFRQNEDKFNQVKTFQFELLERKLQKKLENFDLSKVIESRMSRQSTQKPQYFGDGITLQLKVELVQKENGFVFFDQSVFEILEFIAKGEIGSISVAKINYELLDEQENNILQKQETLAQPHTHYMTNGLPRESKTKERVIIKQIPFNKNNYFDKIFHHLAKIQKVNCHEGLLKYKGFCITQIDDIAFELWIVYPKLEYNLYAIIKQNILDSDQKKIKFALQLAEILKKLHDNGSHHGNVKPSNILMDNEFNAYLSDWEFSSKMSNIDKVIKHQKSNFKVNENNQESPNIDDDGSLDKNPLYSNGYIAPELLQNTKTQQLKQALTDVWGIGMVYYYLFSGKDPSFSGLIQEQQLYDKNNLKIQREEIKNTQIISLIESMVMNDASQRISMTQVRDILTSL